MATEELSCARHHTPTHLACAQCGRPACPKCLVWTEVGQKCRTCVPSKGAQRRVSQPMLLALAAAGIVVALVAGLAVIGQDDPTDVARVANAGTRRPGLGQPARDGALTFVVAQLDCDRQDLEAGAGRGALGRFCVLDFTATNTGTRPAVFGVANQLLLDGQRRRFAPDIAATAAYLKAAGSPEAADFGPSRQMNPGAALSASLVYDIPEGVTPEVAELHASGSGLGVTVRLSGSGTP